MNKIELLPDSLDSSEGNQQYTGEQSHNQENNGLLL